jgi:hypothetical protein
MHIKIVKYLKEQLPFFLRLLKLIVAQLVRLCPSFCGNRKFIIVFTRDRHGSCPQRDKFRLYTPLLSGFIKHGGLMTYGSVGVSWTRLNVDSVWRLLTADMVPFVHPSTQREREAPAPTGWEVCFPNINIDSVL